MGNPIFSVPQNSGDRLAVLEGLVAKQSKNAVRLNVLEVGSYEGGSALMFSHAIAKHCEHGGEVMCVDPWLPYLPEEDVVSNETCGRMQEALKTGEVFKRFCENITFSDPRAKIRFQLGTLPTVLPTLGPDEQFDLIYIDGSHVYQDVRKDILISKPLLKVGGIMCGDDLERQFEDVDQEFTQRNKHREYAGGYHPGVTLAVAKAFGRVWCENGVWAVRKVDRTCKNWSSP